MMEYKSIKYSTFLILILALLITSYISIAQDQDYVEGYVWDTDEKGQKQPLPGASVFWLNSTTGTTTDDAGYFKLSKLKGKIQLVITYVGYLPDTVDASGDGSINILLKGAIEMENVEIVYRQKSTQIDYLDSRKVENMTSKELMKAACCNLSESFETNPSVDVSFQDAVTGTRQIMMLGLAGPNIQIMRENMPDIRGLSAIYGLTYIPGTWIDGIQVVKGAGSVVNGYESIAGQINVNLLRPKKMDRVYLNTYINEGGRMEGNAAMRFDINEDLGTAVLLHGSKNPVKHDRNEDGFLDMTLGNNAIVLNRWDYENDQGVHLEAGIKGTLIDKTGGETDFDPDFDSGSLRIWGMSNRMRRIEGWSKLGKVNIQKPWQSAGLQLSGSSHLQESHFGNTYYEGKQESFYANLLFQSIILSTNHKVLTGLSLQFDQYHEVLNERPFEREEIVPGAFVEYTYNYLEKFTAVAGMRADQHNLYGMYLTPRLHLRYAVSPLSVLRVSGGRGFRTASILSENNGILASSREVVIESLDPSLPYGLNAEIAWNYGINFIREFTLDYRDGYFSFDFYRTDFTNQIVVDYDRNPQTIVFYNLEGKSYSNSFQTQVDYEVLKRVDLRIAYRWFDVKTTYDGILRQKPLLSQHRFFVNLGYESRKYWKIDYTFNWMGRKRIPDTFRNPEPYQLTEYSPDFFLMNLQVSKIWREKLDVYVGAENLLNFIQEDPILSSDDPFSPYFDSSLVWGPIFGRNVYMGLRYLIR